MIKLVEMIFLPPNLSEFYGDRHSHATISQMIRLAAPKTAEIS